MMNLVINKPDIFNFGRLKDNLIRKFVHAMIGLSGPYTPVPVVHVADLSHKIAGKIQFDRKAIEDITLAGFLHYIGRQAVPDTILSKPTQLTDQEFELIRTQSPTGCCFDRVHMIYC